jgi:hypothetical protein
MTNYESLLLTDEWQSKRLSILKRDGKMCQVCGTYGKRMEVHHTYYQVNLSPWEYEDSSLITVCRKCHKRIHMKENIPFLDRDGTPIANTPNCGKCGGSGYIPIYRHIQDGICFKCWGSGVDMKELHEQLHLYTSKVEQDDRSNA